MRDRRLEQSPYTHSADRTWEQMSPRVYRNLDEIFAGEYEGLTYEEIKKKVRYIVSK